MRLGVMVDGSSPERLIEQLLAARDAGYDGVQITPAPASDPEPIQRARADTGLAVLALGGYVNPLTEDLQPLRDAIAIAPLLGCDTVVTWSGTQSADLFADNANNLSAEVFDQTVGIFREVANDASEAGVKVAIEPFHHHIARSPQRLRDLIDAVGSPHLVAVMDPPNFVAAPDVSSVNDMMPGMFATLEGRIGLAHAKDLRLPAAGETEGVLAGVVLPGPGEGILDYPTYLRLLESAGVDALVVEHIATDAFRSARTFVNTAFAESGGAR